MPRGNNGNDRRFDLARQVERDPTRRRSRQRPELLGGQPGDVLDEELRVPVLGGAGQDVQLVERQRRCVDDEAAAGEQDPVQLVIGEDHAISGLGCGGTAFGGFIVIPMSSALIGVYSYHVDVSDASQFAEMSASLSVPPGWPSAPYEMRS